MPYLDSDSTDNNQTDTAQDLHQQLIEEFVGRQKARVTVLNTATELLFFVSCQICSASLALYLFQYAVSVWFTCLLCSVIAWLPLLSQVSDFSFTVGSDGWEFVFMGSYFKAIFKFVFGVGVVSISITAVKKELTDTVQAISETYRTIQQIEQPQVKDFLPPITGQIILFSVAIVSIGYLIDRLKK